MCVHSLTCVTWFLTLAASGQNVRIPEGGGLRACSYSMAGKVARRVVRRQPDVSEEPASEFAGSKARHVQGPGTEASPHPLTYRGLGSARGLKDARKGGEPLPRPLLLAAQW
jgi:hypothetical protein